VLADRSADPAQHGLRRLGYEMSVPGGTHPVRAIATWRPPRLIEAQMLSWLTACAVGVAFSR